MARPFIRSLEIRRFGPVKEGRVEFKPLTVFIGPNSSGKSLIAKLYYALTRFLMKPMDFLGKSVIRYALEYEDAVIPYIAGGQEEAKRWIMDEVRRDIVGILGDEISNFENIYVETDKFNLRLGTKNEIAFKPVNKSDFKEYLKFVAYYSGKEYLRDKNNLKILSYFYRIMSDEDVVYVPEHRGYIFEFMDILDLPSNAILYREFRKVLRDSMDYVARSKGSISAFAYQILNIADVKVSYSPKLRRWVFKYGRKKLSRSSLSSGLKQLLPFYYLFAYLPKGTMFIVEEPELSLHPGAQKELMEFIAFLVREGYKFIITTHSDYIISILNHLILRNTAGRLDRPNIPPEKVGVYLFEKSGKRSVIKDLEVMEDGVSEDEFTDILVELHNETIDMMEEIEELKSTKEHER